jgi:hypothetical protein
MKLSLVFSITAVLLILTAIMSFFAPPSLIGNDPTAAFSSKLLGVQYFAFGALAWLVRNAEASKTRDSVVMGYIILFVLWTLVSVYGIFLTEMPTHNISWIPALIQAILALGFIIAGRSKSAG